MSRKPEWGRRSSDNQAYPKIKPDKSSLPTGLRQVTPKRLSVWRYDRSEAEEVEWEEFPYEELDPKIVPLVKTFHRLGLETFGSCQGHYFEGRWKPAFMTFSATPEQINWIKENLSDLENLVIDVAPGNAPPYYSFSVFASDDYGFAVDFPENPREVTDEVLFEASRRLAR